MRLSSKTTPNSASESTALMESPSSLRNAGRSSTATVCPSLPAEIWQIIFSVGEFDKQDGVFWSDYEIYDLASICRSCTLFRDLVRPRLYYNFISYYNHISHPHVLTRIGGPDGDKREPYSFLKFAWTITTNPRLASLVRRVEIQGVCDMWEAVSEPPIPLEHCSDETVASAMTRTYPDHPMASVLTRKAAELGMVFRYYDIYTIVHSPQNVGFDLVALVLAQLPMLDTLDLTWCGTTPMRQMPQPRGVWPWNQSIRNMTLKYLIPADSIENSDYLFRDPRQRPAPGDRFRPLLPLFCSETRLTGLSLRTSSGPNFALRLDNLREVIIVDCHFRHGQFRTLLKSCRSLTKFVTVNADPSFAWEIVEALEPAYSSLEILGLDLQGYNHGPRISSFQQFTALKTLYLDMTCVWDMQVYQTKVSPPSPDMLLTTLLPESIEEVALFNGGLGRYCEFELEAHVRRLALERKVKKRFQHLRCLHGVCFRPIDCDLKSDVELALAAGDPDKAREMENHVARRFATLDETRTLMSDEGVEFTFDFDQEMGSYLTIGRIISDPDV